MSKLLAIIRIRGSMETRRTTEAVLHQMHLTRKNHCTLLNDSPQTRGMLILSKDFITWGGIDKPTLEKLLLQRGEVSSQKLTEETLAKNSKFKSISEFANALLEGTATLRDVENLKPLFRLNPPLKGFRKSIKRPYPKGALGDRKDKINELLSRML